MIVSLTSQNIKKKNQPIFNIFFINHNLFYFNILKSIFLEHEN